MDDKVKLMEMLKQDMKHWSADALKEARRFVDDKCLNQTDSVFWWWKIRKAIDAELEARKRP